MFREHEIEVLVAGAGPVGLFSALALAENGIQVEIIDSEWRVAAQSYACALHPRTIRLLDQKGLGAELFEIGRRIDTVGFFEGEFRRAEIKLSELNSEHPFLLVLPQYAFENLLEHRLEQHDRVKVEWNHRLADLESVKGKPVATIERLAETGKGYGVPSFDWVVEKTLRANAAFVVGADGHDSHVRQLLDIDYEICGQPKVYAVFECECCGECPNEVRIMRAGSTVNGFWPLLGDRCRWSFQLPDAFLVDDSHPKDRISVVIEQPGKNDEVKSALESFIQERAPWFEGEIREIDWSVDVRFESRVATRYGQDRCWLVGDSAHQTVPLGMHSMNVGLFEADELAGILTGILREGEPLEILEKYNAERRRVWHRLLGFTGKPQVTGEQSRWIEENRDWIMPCVPASGDDLSILLRKIGLEISPNPVCA